MEMDLLLKRVKKELDAIADKGITSSNLETTYKLIDIYKDIKEVCKIDEEERSYSGKRYMDGERYNTHPLDDKTERYISRMKDGMIDYNEGKMRYRDGGSETRMIDGIEMTMTAILNFIESLMDVAETSQEKEIVRRYISRIRNV